MKKKVIIPFILIITLLSLSAIPVLAFQGVGGSPYAADLLVSGLNTGSLDPGQEYWYAYSRLDLGDASYNTIILSLNFEAEGVSAANRVNFQVFTFEQVETWLADSRGPVESLGLGTPASADFDSSTGERLWSGPVAPNEVYYVRIFNLSPSPAQFRLTALGQHNSELDPFLDLQQPNAANESVIPAAMSIPDSLVKINQAEPSTGAASTIDVEADSPASTSWLLAAQAINGLPPQEAAAWLMSAAMLGWLPGSDSGSVEPAAVPVNPNPDSVAVVDTGDEGAESEVVSEEAVEEALPLEPDTLKGDNIYPNNPAKLELFSGPTTGRLAPKTEHWYTFTPGKVDDKLIEDLSLTMFFTPGEPNLSRHVTFEMFTGSQYQIWERGTPQDMEHFGAGSWVSRDGDYITGERLWRGTVVDGDQYFVKITNDTNKWIDYHLFPDDIINTELGEPTVKDEDFTNFIGSAPTGKDIGVPLVINKGHTDGKLSAYEDVWFSFRTPNTNPDSFDFLPYLFELKHRPGIGNVTNYVNVEIYPFQEQQIWRRGDTDQIQPLGAGSVTEYDEIENSHTYVWDGHLVSNTIYFVRVRNDSPQEIDYNLLIRGK